MTDAQTVPQSNSRLRSPIPRILALAVVSTALACVPLQQPLAESVELLLIPGLVAAPAGLSSAQPAAVTGARVPLTPLSMTALEFLRMDVPRDGSWIAARVTVPADSFPYSTRAGVLAFGGPSREPVAVLRVLHADTSWRRTAAADVRRAVAGEALRALLIVPGPLGPRDVDVLVSTASELAAGARAGGAAEVLIAVAGMDTAAYPSRLLATIANGLLITMDPAAYTPTPGPPVTLDEMRRTVALRTSEVGRGRLVLLLPAHGYAWVPDSLPRVISFEEGTRLAAEWRVPLLRDAASEALYARSPERGELWLTDGRLIARLAREARAMGLRRFAVVLGAGEDPAAADSLAAGLQITGSSR
jgi:hypothetical protein